MEFHHVPVLLEEAIELLNIKPDGVYVDCTLGGGGHSEAILKKLKGGFLLGIDQDKDAIQAASKRLEAYPNFRAVHANFKELKNVLKHVGICQVDGILFDIGVSSYQLDQGERGFSYMQDAPLDMRMDRSQTLTAKELVNNLAEEKLAQIIWQYGEERWSKRIARFIVERREKSPIETTGQLVEIIKAAIPAGARRKGHHPAKKTFQALRIAVNNELGVLTQAVQDGVEVLKKDGRIAVITFHSLEDRIVKDTLRTLAKGCQCPPNFPLCTCGQKPQVEILTKKPVVASAEELETNPRARSAKLRAAVKK